MDLLLEAQLHCFKWLWNMFLTEKKHENKRKTGICYPISPPLLIKFSFQYWSPGWFKKSLVKLSWHLTNMGTKMLSPTLYWHSCRWEEPEGDTGGLQTCQRRSVGELSGHAACDAVSHISVVIHKYPIISFTASGLASSLFMQSALASVGLLRPFLTRWCIQVSLGRLVRNPTPSAGSGNLGQFA